MRGLLARVSFAVGNTKGNPPEHDALDEIIYGASTSVFQGIALALDCQIKYQSRQINEVTIMKRAVQCAVIGIAIFSATAAFAAGEITEPTEVGSTSMPPGEYTVIHNGTNKAYTLMVTSKGIMIMSPDKPDAVLAPSATSTPAAAATSTAAAAGATAATSATQAAAPVKSGASSLLSNDLVKGLMQKGMKEGTRQLTKMGGQGQINKLLKP